MPPPFFTPLPFYFLACTGDKTIEFLQGQLTCNMAALTPTTPLWGGYCTVQGRLQGLCYVFLHHNTVYLAFPYDKAVLTHCHTALQRVAPFSKVIITPTPEWQATGVAGPLPHTITDPTFTLPTPTEAHLIFSQAPPSLPYPQKPLLDWHKFEFESKLPYITATTLDKWLPHDINVVALGGVNFKKGCYLGQEIVARMHYKGSLKKQLHLVKGGPPPPAWVNALSVGDETWYLIIQSC